jgi:hypothetical protein
MNCRKTQRLLVDYLEDSLAERAARSIRRHLASCDICRQELKLMKQIRENIALLSVPELSEKEWDAFQRALSEKLAVQNPLPAPRPLFTPAWKIAGALAAAACVSFLFAVPTLNRFLHENNQSAAEKAAQREISGDYAANARDMDRDMLLALADFSEEEITQLLSDPVIVADNGWEGVNGLAGFGLPFGLEIHDELAELTSEECDEMLRRLESLSKGETS